MALHFVTHRWDVADVADGTFVSIAPRDLDSATLAVLVDDLADLVRESGRPMLYLDFAGAGVLPSMLAGKLLALHRRLRAEGCRLVLLNLRPAGRKPLRGTPLAP